MRAKGQETMRAEGQAGRGPDHYAGRGPEEDLRAEGQVYAGRGPEDRQIGRYEKISMATAKMIQVVKCKPGYHRPCAEALPPRRGAIEVCKNDTHKSKVKDWLSPALCRGPASEGGGLEEFERY